MLEDSNIPRADDDNSIRALNLIAILWAGRWWIVISSIISSIVGIVAHSYVGFSEYDILIPIQDVNSKIEKPDQFTTVYNTFMTKTLLEIRNSAQHPEFHTITNVELVLKGDRLYSEVRASKYDENGKAALEFTKLSLQSFNTTINIPGEKILPAITPIANQDQRQKSLIALFAKEVASIDRKLYSKFNRARKIASKINARLGRSACSTINLEEDLKKCLIEIESSLPNSEDFDALQTIRSDIEYLSLERGIAISGYRGDIEKFHQSVPAKSRIVDEGPSKPLILEVDENDFSLRVAHSRYYTHKTNIASFIVSGLFLGFLISSYLFTFKYHLDANLQRRKKYLD
jgi:hypothetical protein